MLTCHTFDVNFEFGRLPQSSRVTPLPLSSVSLGSFLSSSVQLTGPVPLKLIPTRLLCQLPYRPQVPSVASLQPIPYLRAQSAESKTPLQLICSWESLSKSPPQAPAWSHWFLSAWALLSLRIVPFISGPAFQLYARSYFLHSLSWVPVPNSASFSSQ